MQFLRALSILGLIVALSIALGVYFDGSLFLFIIGAWVLSAPMILLDAWLRSPSDENTVSVACSTREQGSVSAVQSEVQKLARRSADE
jgi:hypothetical protein